VIAAHDSARARRYGGRASLKALTILAGLVLSVLGAGAGGLAQTITVSIPAERDSTLMQAHPHDSDGAWGFLWPKWNSERLENRILLGFDLTPLAGRAADVLGASVILTASSHTFPAKRGTVFHIHAMEPGALVDWVEGDGRFDTFAYCSRRDLRRPGTGVGGPGVTWTCEAEDVEDGAPICLTPWSPPTAWLGGFAQAGEPPDHLPRGFRTVPTDSPSELKGYAPLCAQALSCFAATGSVDCWRRVTLDVTPDVREMLATGRFHPSWLIRKDRVEAGGAYFFSREGAVCIMGVRDLRPQLLVTLVGTPADPPTIPEPPDHCEASD